MGTLRIGRVGLDVALRDPAEWEETRGFEDRTLTLRGFLNEPTYANTDYLRRELLEQQGQLIACTYSLDPHFDGFYILSSARVESVPVSYRGGGLFPFEVELFRIGSESRAELQSLLTVVDITNDHGITGVPFHAPPVDHLAYNAGSGTPTEISRTGTDGTLAVYTSIAASVDPTWAVAPSSYYGGAVELRVDNLLRAGLDAPNKPTSWELENSLVRVRPTIYGGSSDGRFEVAWHDGTAWGTWIKWRIDYAGTTVVPQWDFLTVIHNTPEMATVRLVRDAATVPASAHRHVLDVTLRRGSRFVSFLYTYTGTAATHKVARDTAEAATAQTGFIQASALTDGNRWMLGSPKAFSADTTNGAITLTAAAQQFPFVIGSAVGDAANGTGNGPSDLMAQYIGWVSEKVRAVWR